MKRARKTTRPEDIAAACDELAELQVRRLFHMRASIRVSNSLGGLLRRALGWRMDIPEAERSRIVKRAARILSAAMKATPQREEDIAIAEALAAEFHVGKQMIAPPDAQRHQIELAMRRAARALPVWEWAKTVKGFSDLGLAVIIAEAGDISKYSNVGKLWKRLGLAPFNKDGTTRAYSQWRSQGGLTADEWKSAGYSPKRRAQMFAQVGGSLIGGMGKGRRPAAGEDIAALVAAGEWSEFEALFVSRLRHEAAKNPEHLRPTTEAGKESYSKHAAMMAQRYVEKRLLKHLWQAWRRAVMAMEPNLLLPAAISSADEAERSAMEKLSPMLLVPSAPIPAQAGERRHGVIS